MKRNIKTIRAEYGNKGMPEGPYTSPWTTSGYYLITTIRNNDVVFAVVPNGTQPHDAENIFLTLREARQWLKDNGFTKKP